MPGLELKPLSDYLGSSSGGNSEVMAMMRMIQQNEERKRKAVIDDMRYKDAMKRQEQDEKHRRVEEARKDRLELYKYEQDKIAQEHRAMEKIERESRHLIVDRIHPLVKEQKERWQATSPLLKNVKVVMDTLNSGGNPKSKLKAYFDSASIQAMDRIFEQITGASRVSVMHESELNSRLKTIEPRVARLARKWNLISTNKNIISPEQRAEFKQFLSQAAISSFKDYKKSLDVFKEEYKATEELISPEYRKKYPLRIPKIHEHEPGLYEKFEQIEKGYDQIQQIKEKAVQQTQQNALSQILK